MSRGRGACSAARSLLCLLGGLAALGCTGAADPAGGSALEVPDPAQARTPAFEAEPGRPDGDPPAQPGGSVAAFEVPAPPGGAVAVADDEDAPLPGENEIPSFLHQRVDAPGALAADAAREASQVEEEPASARTQEPTLAELLRGVRFSDEGADEEEGSFASVIATDEDDGGAAPPAQLRMGPRRGQAEDGDLAGEVSPSPAPDAVADPDDPCAGIRAAIAEYQAYLERIGAERTAFAYVENAEDATALRLLQAMRRCAEFPSDPDCQAPPMEVELRDVEPPRHTYESWPTDLLGEGKDPDEIAHDPRIRDLTRQLRECETARKAQPLLE